MTNLDDYGWGSGLQDPSPPIAAGDRARECRELLLRQLLELQLLQVPILPLEGLFATADPEQKDLSRLVRFLGLIDRLLTVELPRLRGALRCQTVEVSRWVTDPACGRVDLATSLRISMARSGPLPPTEWLVHSTRRKVDTPVNRLAAAILTHTDRFIRVACSQQTATWGLRFREKGVLYRARREIRRTLVSTPLSEAFPVHESPLVLAIAAARWRTEYRRVVTLVHWWSEFSKCRLEAIRDRGGLSDLSVSCCYELLAVSSLLLALSDCFRLEPSSHARTISFRGAKGIVELELGRALTKRGRPVTSYLRVLTDGSPPLTVAIEARNTRAAEAAGISERLAIWEQLHAPNALALLLTPDGPKTPMAPGPRWRAFPAGSPGGRLSDPIANWDGALGDVLARLKGSKGVCVQ